MAKPAKSAKPSKALATPKPSSTAIATIDSELDQELANIKEHLKQATGQSLKVSNGQFLLPDGTNLGSQISFVVVEYLNANKYYPEIYDPNKVVPPDCVAYGKAIKDMAPLDESRDKQNDICATCWANQFKSDVRKKGKACKNTKDLAIILDMPDAGYSLDDANPQLFKLTIPPTSLTYVDGAFSAAAKIVGHPIKAVFTVDLEVVGTYSLYHFSPDIRPNQNYAVHAALRSTGYDMIFIKPDYEAAEARNATAAPAARGPARRPQPPARKAAGASARR